MTEIRGRERGQAPPAWVLFEALTQPDRDPARPWLKLGPDEVAPRVLEALPNSLVVWSSIFLRRPDAVIRFSIDGDEWPGCRVGWTMQLADEVAADEAEAMRYRLSRMINADLRFTFGQ